MASPGTARASRGGAHVGHTRVLLAEEEDNKEGGDGVLGQLAGLPAGPARWAAGEITLSLSLLILFLFSIYVILF